MKDEARVEPEIRLLCKVCHIYHQCTRGEWCTKMLKVPGLALTYCP